MTAIGLLMRVFQSRPAAFALLDEADAALDEANNNGFNRLVLEFAASAQFIITLAPRGRGARAPVGWAIRPVV